MNKNPDSPYCSIADSSLFDSEYYKGRFNLDWTGIDPVEHFCRTWMEHLQPPSEQFDLCRYLAAHPDVFNEGINPLYHYLTIRKSEYTPTFPVNGKFNEKTIFEKLTNRATNYPRISFIHKTLAVFCCHPRNFRISDAVIHYLEELKAHADGIVFVADSYLPFHEILKIRHLLCAYDCRNHNKGYMESFRAGLKLLESANLPARADTLLLACDAAIPVSLSPLHDLKGKGEELTPIAELKVAYSECGSFPPALVCVNPASLAPEYRRGTLQALEKLFSPAKTTSEESVVSVRPFGRDIIFIPNILSCLDNLLLLHPGRGCLENASREAFTLVEKTDSSMEALKKSNTPFYNLLKNSGMCLDGRLPGISVILPVGWPGAHIFTLIDDILGQDYAKFELLLVDAGNWPGLQKEISLRYPRELAAGKLKYIQDEILNAECASFSKAMSLAAHGYILHLSDTSKMDAGFLDYLAIFAVANSETDIFHIPSGITLYDLENQPLENLLADESHYRAISGLFHKSDFDFGMLKGLLDNTWTSEYYFLKELYNNVYITRIKSLFLRKTARARGARMIPAVRKSSKPFVSTIILANDSGLFLEECVESALMQSGKFSHEIIIADCNLSEAGRKTACALAKEFAGIARVADYSRLGHAQRLKTAISEARGNYTCLLYGHDYWNDPFKIASQIDFMEDGESFKMCFSASLVLDQFLMQVYPLRYEEVLPQKITAHELLDFEEVGAFFSSALYETEILRHVPAGALEYSPVDYLLAVFFCNYGNIGFLPQRQVVQRKFQASLWYRFTKLDYLARYLKMRETAEGLLPLSFKPKIERINALLQKELREHEALLANLKKGRAE